MRLPRVGTPQQDDVRLFNLLVRAGAPARPKYRRQTGDAGGVSSTVAAIDVVRADHRPDKLLRHIIQLVGRFRATEHTERVRPVFGELGAEAFGHPVQSFVPGRRPVAAIFAYIRLGQPFSRWNRHNLPDCPLRSIFITLGFMHAANSIRTTALEELRKQLATGDGITGIVAVSAVSASLALSVVEMVLRVAARKRDSEKLRGLLTEVHASSDRLMRLADEDRASYGLYREALKLPKGTDERRQAITSALRRATETPLAAARTAASAIDLCGQAASLVEGDIAADVRGAAVLLAGAARAILASVDVNLEKLQDQPFYSRLAGDRRELEGAIAVPPAPSGPANPE